MTEPVADLLLRIERLLHSGRQQEARLLLVDYLKSNPVSVRAWWLMSLAVSEPAQKIDCLQRVLRLDPGNELARGQLEIFQKAPPTPAVVNPFTEPVGSFIEPEPPAEQTPVTPAWAAPVATPPESAVPTAQAQPAALEPPGSGEPLPPVPLTGAQSAPRRKMNPFVIIILLMLLVVGLLLIWSAVQNARQKQQASLATQSNLQMTRDMAGMLTSLPLPTLAPTWTASPTASWLPTATRRPTVTLTPSPEFTFTRTPVPTGLIGPERGLFPPDFSLVDVDTGSLVSLSQFDGQAVMLVFFRSAETISANELAAVEGIYTADHASGLVVLGICSGGSGGAVESFCSAGQLTFPILLDADSSVRKVYRVETVPSHFFINITGRIAAIVTGEMTPNQMKVQAGAIMLRFPTATP